MSSCEVCVEKLNRSTRKAICCSKCEYTVCRTCCETYILGSGKIAGCMNCKVTWDQKFLTESFTKRFLANEYRTLRTRLLLDTERQLYPQTQALIEYNVQLMAIHKEISRLNVALTIKRTLRMDLLKRLNVLQRQRQQKDGFTKEIVQKQLDKIEQELQDNADDYEQNLQHFNEAVDKKKQLETNFRLNNVAVTKKCPSVDCRGFLNNDFVCGLCNSVVCKTCHELTDNANAKMCSEHVCDPDAVANVRLIEAETRNCPKCMIKISKIDGCDQIFCTQCHTAFSWNTGLIETGTIHNPHYIEMLRQGKSLHRNLLEIRCGREIDTAFIETNCSIASDKMRKLCLIVKGLCTYYLPTYVNARPNNQDIRVKYLANIISETELARITYIRAREVDRYRDLGYVLHMFVNVMTEIVYRYFDELHTNGLVENEKYNNEIEWVTNYTLEHFKNINQVYNSKDRSVINALRSIH